MTTKAEIRRQASQLPKAEQIELVIELWDSIGAESIAVPDWHREIIRERLKALETMRPEDRSLPWEEVHKRVFTEGA
jgi:putative addiction module component (TIGR02574 family)